MRALEVMMGAKKLKRLKATGGRVTTTQEFLGLTAEDIATIESKPVRAVSSVVRAAPL